MIVVPAINETNFEEVKKKIKAAQEFGAEWVHLDIADGKFTPNKLWNNPEDLRATDYALHTDIEVHLMVENPNEVFKNWLDAGVRRLIIHLESIDFGKSNFLVEVGLPYIENMKQQCEVAGAELMLAINPDTPVEKLLEYKDITDKFLILAVSPGLAGQKFLDNQLEKIKVLREKIPDAIIEVDGGINLETAKLVREAGANIVASASFIWKNDNSKLAYELLTRL